MDRITERAGTTYHSHTWRDSEVTSSLELPHYRTDNYCLRGRLWRQQNSKLPKSRVKRFPKWQGTDGQLFKTIRELVEQDKYVIGQHASERLEERGIMEWQVVVGLEDGELMVERPDTIPNPTVEVRECLPDGTEFKAVWSHLRQSGVAKLVTVHFFDRV